MNCIQINIHSVCMQIWSFFANCPSSRAALRKVPVPKSLSSVSPPYGKEKEAEQKGLKIDNSLELRHQKR